MNDKLVNDPALFAYLLGVTLHDNEDNDFVIYIFTGYFSIKVQKTRNKSDT